MSRVVFFVFEDHFLGRGDENQKKKIWDLGVDNFLGVVFRVRLSLDDVGITKIEAGLILVEEGRFFPLGG